MISTKFCRLINNQSRCFVRNISFDLAISVARQYKRKTRWKYLTTWAKRHKSHIRSHPFYERVQFIVKIWSPRCDGSGEMIARSGLMDGRGLSLRHFSFWNTSNKPGRDPNDTDTSARPAVMDHLTDCINSFSKYE